MMPNIHKLLYQGSNNIFKTPNKTIKESVCRHDIVEKLLR